MTGTQPELIRRSPASAVVLQPTIPSRLTPLETALGLPYDEDDVPVLRLPSSAARHGRGAPSFACSRASLEQTVLAGLLRPPCLISFSGGRDSSAVLAVAMHVARREGLPLPVPVSLRFPAAPWTDETVWQERVVSYLQVPDWHVLTLHDELDLLGPHALRLLRRHGPYWPPNAHLLLPAAALAPGGSVLTGLGGDEVLGRATWHRLNLIRWAAPVRARPTCAS